MMDAPALQQALQSPPAVEQMRTVLSPMNDSIATIVCQVKVRAGYETPGPIRLTDATTGEVLFYLAVGDSVETDKCINAPDGHSMIADMPGVGSVFKPVQNSGATP